ncbi:hypothetical protein H4R21_004314 [Coemansia helicoidea]|uniref:Uncharacterized protein n=1 Tax=Coemansia helicoidea TaxID=1286919 RepID=A0ACC1KXS8_9FUNG|nr:hypothetical protein H4R21_004314 [Coemansia helicoidea]
MFRPKLPFFRKTEHRRLILAEYRKLLSRAKHFADPVEQTYLWSWIRERFHHNKRETSPKKVQMQLSDAAWVYLSMGDALAGANDQQKYISDLAYGRAGWLKDVARQVVEFSHPTSPCQLLRDVRPRSAQIHQPHRAYWIPLDLRAFAAPQHLVDRSAEYDRHEQRRELERRQRREKRLAREIGLLTDAVNGGNRLLWDAGLVAGAFTAQAQQSPHRIAGIPGNPAWVPPKIRNRLDPPFVQHVRASIGYEFLRVNARKPPHWLGAKISAMYRRLTRRLLQHEFYFHFIEDLRLEEEFEARLGVHDPGYWIFARNYREYLRAKIKEYDAPPLSSPQSCDPPELVEAAGDSYQRMLDHAEAQLADRDLHSLEPPGIRRPGA